MVLQEELQALIQQMDVYLGNLQTEFEHRSQVGFYAAGHYVHAVNAACLCVTERIQVVSSHITLSTVLWADI